MRSRRTLRLFVNVTLALLVPAVSACASAPDGKNDLATKNDNNNAATDSKSGRQRPSEDEGARTAGPSGAPMTPGPTETCTADGECGADRICLKAACIAGCRANKDCPADSVCAKNVCAKRSSSTLGGCTDSSECDFGTICTAGSCIVGCHTTVDCFEDERCVAGTCETNTSTRGDAGTEAGAACTDHADCFGGTICSSKNVCINPCNSDRDCPGTQLCRSLECQ